MLNAPADLLPILQQTFPAVASYSILSDVVQANAEGHLLELDAGGNNDETPDRVFVKQVIAKNYVETKSWPDFRRTMMYMRTETRFYTDVLPQLQGVVAPHVYFAECDLEGLVSEEERATDPAGDEPEDWKRIVKGKGGVIIMEAVDSESRYFQDSPLGLEDVKRTLTAAATMHAAAWERTDLLSLAETRLSRGSYHLATRNPKELAGMVDSWNHFYDAIVEPHSQSAGYLDLVVRTKTLGIRLQRLAQYVSDETSPSPTDKYATLAHGDYKSMNCFLPKDVNEQVILVDFASTGVGLGMSDVAMHIHHAVRPEDLGEDDIEMALVDHYLKILNAQLGRSAYPSKEEALRQYRLAVVDYCRFVLGRFWKSATVDSFEKKRASKNTTLINRDLQAALAFCNRVERYLTLIENERNQETEEL